MTRLVKGVVVLMLAFLVQPDGLRAQAPTNAVPRAISYQGRLTDDQGVALANGEYTVSFQFWSDAVSASTTGPNHLVWGREKTILLINGSFSVILDDQGTPIAGARVQSVIDAFSDANRYLGLTLIRTPVGTVPAAQRREIQPRQQILATPYAFVAHSLAADLQDSLCPPGIIQAYGGRTNWIPKGWLLCDGSPLSSALHPRLFAAIGTNWGAGLTFDGKAWVKADISHDFNLPDLRGVFLRGMSGSRADTFRDEDADSRQALVPGAASGNSVGSFQIDELEAHTHKFTDVYSDNALSDDANDRWVGSTQRSTERTTTPTGGKETRPKNAAVLYLIRY
jgi:rhizosphere induced protein